MNDNSLISKILEYLDGTIDLDDLEDWYIPKLELLINNPGTANITAQLELELAEFQAEFQTEYDLKNNLRNAIENSRPKIIFQAREDSFTSGSGTNSPQLLDFAESSPVESAINWGDLVYLSC